MGGLPDLWRTYRLMKAFPGLTPQTVDDTPALTWDWLLRIHEVVLDEQNRKSEEARRG